MTCQIPNGCILHEQSGACPLCDEDGADIIANWLFEESYKVMEGKIYLMN